MDSPNTIGQSSSESIDFNKLGVIIKNNKFWIALILIVINAAAYLFIRYTKNLYESESELKLEIRSEASDLGINNMLQEPNANVLSGEIELIQSRLFLNRVLDNSNFEISFYSVGRVLNDEMYRNAPAFITALNANHSLYNTAIYFEEINSESFTLRIGENGDLFEGKYDKIIQIKDLSLKLKRNENFRKGDEVGYFFLINSRDVLLNYLLRNLTAEPINYQASTIRVTFKDYNAMKAQAVLNKIDTLYLAYSNEQKNLANKQKIDWLTRELTNIEKRMEDFEDYFEAFTIENRTSNLNEDLQRTITSLHEIDSQRYITTQQIRSIHELEETIRSKQTELSFTGNEFLPQSLTQQVNRLSELQIDQERLKLSYNEVTFAYQAKAKEYEALKDNILNQLSNLSQSLVKKLEQLNRRKIDLENEFIGLPDKTTQYSKNQRFYKLYEEFYLSMMQSKSEFEIAQAGSIPDFKILSPASLPSVPISPKRFIITGIGLVASLMTVLFFVGFLYLINNRITNLYEIEKIASVPVLGVVPASRYSTSGLHVSEHPKSMVSEAIRTLRTNLDFFTPGSSKKVVAVSSTVSGEGKSFIAMNLGGALAMSNKKVVLMDLDMRKTKTDLPVTDIDLSRGVSTILIRKNTWEECVMKTTSENFDFIPAGPHPPNPSELLLNGEFTSLLDNLKKHYDFIIMDTPPVGLVTDGIMAMKKADVSIYVFRANYSKKEFVQNLQRIVSVNKFHNITTILNAVPTKAKTYGYGYYEESARSGGIKSLFRS